MEREPVIVHVGGAPGVGKTTILKEIAATLKYPVCLIPIGVLINRIAADEFNSQYFYLLDIERKNIVREKAIKYILSLNEYDLILLDSQYVDMEADIDKHMKPMMPVYFMKRVDIYVDIESSEKEILRRRMADSTKKRICELETITKEIKAEKNLALTIANEFCKPVYIINNDNIEEAAKIFIDIMERYIANLEKIN
ncbi:MAG: AAA family ATPase [Candidatus Paceibacterota bacterium]